MNAPPQLGTRAALEAGAAAKAATLDRAAAAGISVPAGVVVLDEIAVDKQLGQAIVRALDSGPLVVRSAFSAEDTASSSMAGYFSTELNIERSSAAVSGALERVRASGAAMFDTDPSLRRDMLVMEQVAAVRAGVAFTQATFEDDLIDVADGLADQLVSGEVAGTQFPLAKLARFERPQRQLPSWQQRLALLLQQVRHEFGAGDWDIEWADDDATCWLIQIRPITVAPVRNEAFTLANHKEILPDLPSIFMTSIVESASRALLDFYRTADPTLPLERDFVETFEGRPYLNLSMLTDLMRALGLPTRLVTNSYGGEPDVVVGVRPLRLLRRLPVLLKIVWPQLSAVRHADDAGTTIERLGTELARREEPPSFTEAVATFRQCYVTLVNQMGAMAPAMALPVVLLKKTGTLDTHLASHRTAATAMLDDLAELAALGKADTQIDDDLTKAVVPDNPSFARLWASWLERHGHRGVFESDIARPRFSEDPAPILSAIKHHRSNDSSPTSPGIWARLTTPIWSLARRPMTAREQLRWQAMRGFAGCRQALLAAAAVAVERGQLARTDDLWLLTAAEVRSLDDHSTVIDQTETEKRRATRNDLAALILPDQLRRFDDTRASTSSDQNVDSFRGVPLVRGVVSGQVLRASEPPPNLPDGFEPKTTILVARSVDAGWIPIFSRVAGVAVEIGGDLSHGSIILRELGVPSITNVGQIGSVLTDGDQVELDASTGYLRIIG